jgi:hypothetical protein
VFTCQGTWSPDGRAVVSFGLCRSILDRELFTQTLRLQGSKFRRYTFIYNENLHMVLTSRLKFCRIPPMTAHSFIFESSSLYKNYPAPVRKEVFQLLSYGDIHQHRKCHGLELQNATVAWLTVEHWMGRSQGCHTILEFFIAKFRPPLLMSSRKGPCGKAHAESFAQPSLGPCFST